jgi:hypothetical protein
MSRPHIGIAVPPLALRRAEAAAACGVPLETFDTHIRPFIPAKRSGWNVVHPTAGLEKFLANSSAIIDDLAA